MNQLGRKYESLAQAVGGKSGTSGGFTTHVPDLLLKVLKTPAFSNLNDLKYAGVESAHGVDCYRVSCTYQSKPIELWIGKADFLLREIRISTPFGTVTESHRDIKVNGRIDDTQVSFTPPVDVEHVDKFDVRKNPK